MTRGAQYTGAAMILFAGAVSLAAGGVVGFVATVVALIGIAVVLEGGR